MYTDRTNINRNTLKLILITLIYDSIRRTDILSESVYLFCITGSQSLKDNGQNKSPVSIKISTFYECFYTMTRTYRYEV